jgi:general secretion pathway protein L
MARIITGIEISSQGIHAVEISVQRKVIHIHRFIEELLDGNTLTPDALSLFCSEHSIRKEYVVTSVPGDMLITRHLSVPFRERSKIDKVIPYEVEPLVPFPIQDLEICYKTLFQEKGRSDLLVYALPKNILDQRSVLFEEAEIPLHMITVSSLASANTLLQMENIQTHGSFLHLHMASNFSILSVYEKGILMHLQRLSSGEESFLGTLQSMSDLDRSDLAAQLKVISPTDASELYETLQAQSFELIPQIRQSLQGYLMRSQGESPNALYVTGTAPGLQLLPRILETEFSIHAGMPDPLPHFKNHLEEDALTYGIYAPLGMALMQAGKDALNSSFRKQKFSLVSMITESRQEIRYAALLLVFLFLAFITDFFVGIQAKEYQFSQLQKETRRIFQETFPDEKNVKNELEQMKLKIKEIEKQNDIFKSLFGEKPSPLEVLNGLSSSIPAEIDLSVMDLTVDEKSIRFVGWTDSFNTVNKIEQELKKQEIFGDVKVSNAKVGKDKSGVNFQIKITLRES